MPNKATDYGQYEYPEGLGAGLQLGTVGVAGDRDDEAGFEVAGPDPDGTPQGCVVEEPGEADELAGVVNTSLGTDGTRGSVDRVAGERSAHAPTRSRTPERPIRMNGRRKSRRQPMAWSGYR